jgi:DnaK suppressor protein
LLLVILRGDRWRPNGSPGEGAALADPGDDTMVRLTLATPRGLSPRQLEQCRRKLAAMRWQLEGSRSLAAGAPSVGVEDEADMATSSAERELTGQLGGVFLSAIADIDRALEKMAEGTYGICEECGRCISSRRLEALPSASLCVRCKREEELAEAAREEPGPRWSAAAGLDELTADDAASRSRSVAARRLG